MVWFFGREFGRKRIGRLKIRSFGVELCRWMYRSGYDVKIFVLYFVFIREEVLNNRLDKMIYLVVIIS